MDLIIFGRYFWSDMELALWKQPQGSPMIGSCDVVALAPPEPHRGCPAGSPVGQRIHLHRTRQNVTRALKNKSGKPPRKNLEKTKLYQHRPQIAWKVSAISAVPIQNMQISNLINFINKDFQKQNGRINTNTIFKKVGTPCQGIVIICEGSPTRHLWRQWRHAAQQPLKTNQLCKFSHAQSNTPRRFLESAAKTFFQEVRS